MPPGDLAPAPGAFRIRRRTAEAADASEADRDVLELQRRRHEPLTAAERAWALEVSTNVPVAAAELAARVRRSAAPPRPTR